MQKPRIDVRTVENIRTMYIEGKAQSAMDLSDPTIAVFDYTRFFYAPLCLTHVKKALFIGGGGFSGPRIYSHLGILTEAVEVNEDVVEIAKTDFAINPAQFSIIVDDGRRYLAKSTKTYDAIIVDAFVAEKVPLQFTTLQFFKLVRDKLNPNGILVYNVITAPDLWFFQSLLRTMQSVFPTVFAFDLTPHSTQTRNMILIVAKQPMTREELLDKSTATQFDLSKEMEFLLSNPQTRRAEILRD